MQIRLCVGCFFLPELNFLLYNNHFKWLLIGQKWIAFFECGQIGNKIDQIKSWLVVCSSHGSTRQAINVTDCPPNCHNSIKIPKRTLFFKNVAFFQKLYILEKVSWSISIYTIPSTYEFWARGQIFVVVVIFDLLLSYLGSKMGKMCINWIILDLKSLATSLFCIGGPV